MSDEIRRGQWRKEEIKTQASAANTRKFGARPAGVPKNGLSKSEDYLAKRVTSSEPSARASAEVSEYRRDDLIRATETNANSDSSLPAPIGVNSGSYNENQKRMKKVAAVTTSSNTSVAGGGNTVRMAPEVYSPLFQIANLQLPRDRITMNAWNRNFYDTHPLVHNCINLHATYPISKINIKCKDWKIEQFFNDMVENMNLSAILQEVALEYWITGEAFPYAELDENLGMWSGVVIQNPDYIHVKQSVLSGDPIISLRPDEKLKALVQSNHPADLQLKKQISDEILYHVRKGENIPLDNFHVSHLKLKARPYDVRGTSVIVGVYKDLVLYDKLRECYSEDTEVLTDQGFKPYWELINDSGEIKDDFKIACFNPDNEQLEYHAPTNGHVSYYEGDMCHFNGHKVDILVTPNHRMWVTTACRKKEPLWRIEKAGEMFMGTAYRFRSIVDWKGEEPEYMEIGDIKIPMEDYLEFLGYIIAEGSVNYTKRKYFNSVAAYQTNGTDDQKKIKLALDRVAKCFGKKTGICVETKDNSHLTKKNGEPCRNSEIWRGSIYNKELTEFMWNDIGENGECDSHNKRIPRWVYNLSPRLMRILIDALALGDAHLYTNQDDSVGARYSTISKALADDVCELSFKCGFAPRVFEAYNGDGKKYYAVSWTETNRGRFPVVCGNPNSKSAHINKKHHYAGNVWCFEVPTGLFVTRRNGLMAVQGNSKYCQADSLVNPITLVKVGGSSEGEYRATDEDLENFRHILESAQYDKDFKIITHAGVTVERVGASGAVLDISGDLEFILNNILYGLMVPKSVLTQEGATYGSATIGLEVMKQRYESFRNMMEQWLVKKVFAPISEIQEFYEFKDGSKKLIVPEVEWNKMVLFDMDNYISTLNQLVGQGAVSKKTLFKSLGLSAEEEERNLREERIKAHIAAQEDKILQTMSLGALKALKPDDDIVEQDEAPVPGAPGFGEEAGVPGTGGMDLGMGGMDLGMGPGGGMESMLGGGVGGGGGVGVGGPEAGGMGGIGPGAGGAGGAGELGGPGTGGAGT